MKKCKGWCRRSETLSLTTLSSIFFFFSLSDLGRKTLLLCLCGWFKKELPNHMNPAVSANTRPKQDDAISLLCDSELDIFRKSLFRCQGRECRLWRGATCQHCLFITRPGVPPRLYCVCDWQVGGAVLSGACHLCCRFWQLIGIVVIVKVMCKNEAVKDGRDDSSEKKGIPAILCLWVCVCEREKFRTVRLQVLQ